MDFIAPGALWLLLLVAILLVLARRQTARVRRPVGNLYMWVRPASSAATEVRFKRLRQHWLLILQAAIVTAIVCALARPMLSWSSRPVALIVDLSASMSAHDGGGPRMEQARQAARRAIDALPRGARVRLFAVTRVATDLGEFSRTDPRLAAAIEGLKATASGGDLARSIRAVRATAGTAPSITVVSDRRDPRVADADVTWMIVGRPAANQAITALAARRLPAAPADGQIIATIWNHAPDAAARELEITQDGQVVSRQRIELAPQHRTTIVNDVESIGGVIRARLVGGDALATDDERAAVVPSTERARVLLMSAGGFFLERALATNPNLTLDMADPAAAPPDADIVVCDRCAELPSHGRSVLIVRTIATAGAAPVSVSLPDHPIAARLDLGGIVAAGADAGPVPQGADVVLRAGPHPAVIAYQDGDRRVVELRLDLATAGFPLHPAFPVLLDNALGWLVSRGENRTVISAGEPFRWRLQAPAAANAVSITGPSGRAIAVTVNGAMVTSTDTGTPGVYTIRSGGVTQPFVVNPVSEGESDVSESDTGAPQPARPLPHSATTLRWELAPLLLVLGLALLVLEWRARVGRARVA